jgi:hypothetical protein
MNMEVYQDAIKLHVKQPVWNLLNTNPSKNRNIRFNEKFI